MRIRVKGEENRFHFSTDKVMAKLLLVDDDEALCDVILSCLAQEQHVVDCAHTGSEAKDLLGLYSYDVIVLDWGLPDMEGVEVSGSTALLAVKHQF